MLRVKSVQFTLHQGRKVKLQHFLSRTLFGMDHVRVKSVQFSLQQGKKDKLQHYFSFVVLYSARIMLGVKSGQFSLHQGRKS